MARKKAEFTYESALQELKDILEKLESGNVSMDHLLDEVTKAEMLLQQCQDRLRQIDEKITAAKQGE